MQDTPYGYCHCGCGELAPISPQTVRKLGYVAGEPRRYIRNHDKRKNEPQYRVDPETGCWVWLWYVSKKGYGYIRPRGEQQERQAHIVFYERKYGPVPEGLQLDHACHDPDTCVGGTECPHRRCVNPDHLKPSTPQENTDNSQTRAGSKQKPGRKPKRKPTHCKHGHEYTPENTIVRSNGWWRCRTCQQASMRTYYQHKPKGGRE